MKQVIRPVARNTEVIRTLPIRILKGSREKNTQGKVNKVRQKKDNSTIVCTEKAKRRSYGTLGRKALSRKWRNAVRGGDG